eukprot:m.8304 g.8304  ORF g.8304 m.8304 type:complete len:448 (+) comp3868_c0_seq1:118-1461(+)
MPIIRLITLALVGSLLASAENEVAINRGEVVTLSDDVMDTFTNGNEITLVNFYADWCRFSQMLKPVFAETARLLAKYPNVGLGSINCESSDTVVTREKYHISKYPTIKVFRRGVALKAEYRGQRSPQAIEAFITELLKDAVVAVQDENDMNEHIQRRHRAVIGHFENEDSPEFNVFHEVAAKLRDECSFLKFIGSPSATSIQFKNAREDIRFDGEIQEEQLFNWAREHCNPIVREITFDNGEELTEEGLPFLILFYSPDDHKPVDDFTKIIKEKFTHERGNINFITADGHKFSHPLRHLGKTKKDLPVLAFDTFKHMYLFKRFNNIYKEGKLEKFVSDLHSGKLHHNLHHPTAEDDDDQDTPQLEGAPKESDGKVDTLKEKVEAAEKRKNPEVPEELKTTQKPGAPEGEVHDDEHDDPSKPVPVKSVLKHLKPSQNRYSFAHNRDEL